MEVKEPSHLSDFSLLDIYTCIANGMINQKQGHVYLKKFQPTVRLDTLFKTDNTELQKISS